MSERLTEKCKNKNNEDMYTWGKSISAVINKLGQLEDIEEEHNMTCEEAFKLLDILKNHLSIATIIDKEINVKAEYIVVDRIRSINFTEEEFKVVKKWLEKENANE